MRRKISPKIFISTNDQKVLSFMAEHPGQGLLPGDVQAATGLSKAGVHMSLKALEEQRLLKLEPRGRWAFYSLSADDMRVRQFKVLKTVMLLESPLRKLQPFVRKIILFGSAARGEDGPQSDLDLFIVAKDTDESQRVVKGWKLKRKVQAVIKTAVDAAAMEKTDAVFMREVASGIVLWEEKYGA